MTTSLYPENILLTIPSRPLVVRLAITFSLACTRCVIRWKGLGTTGRLLVAASAQLHVFGNVSDIRRFNVYAITQLPFARQLLTPLAVLIIWVTLRLISGPLVTTVTTTWTKPKLPFVRWHVKMGNGGHIPGPHNQEGGAIALWVRR